MRDYVHEHFAKYPDRHVRPIIVCEDGMAYSVQASDTHYCSPREKGAERYGAVEVWAINKNGKYGGGGPEGWVDVTLVNRRIHKHGGPAE